MSAGGKRIAALHLQIIFGTRQGKEKPRNSVNKMMERERARERKKSIRHARLSPKGSCYPTRSDE